MIQQHEFIQWFKKEVKGRWPKHNFDWTQIGDWHWRLRDDFDLDTLTEAVRRHKVCDDWRVPSLKKVYGYAKTIQSTKRPQRQRAEGADETSSTLRPEHTYIMCVARSANGGGCVGWFVPILLWPFKTRWTPDDYRRVAEEQCQIHSRNGRAGVWKIFPNTTYRAMRNRAMALRGTNPLTPAQLRRQGIKTAPRP